MLVLVPTPIGNLEDISYRSLQVLQDSQIVFCEDTRVTKRLFHLLSEKYNLSFSNKEFKSFHSHNEKKIIQELTVELFDKNIVYLSDAGMPCVSDPGASLVEYCIQNSIPYDVLPGANAVLTAFALSGFSQTEFTFYGFLAHKGKERQNKLEEALNSTNLSILYESPHRLLKLLEELYKKDSQRTIFLAKEISKLHQKTYKNSAENIYNQLKKESIKGEWVVIIDSIEKIGTALDTKDILSLDIAPKVKAKLLSKMTNRSVKEVYQELLDKI